MERVARFLFNLRRGEGKKASLFVLLAIFWAIGGYGTFTLSEGMFLERVGADGLPYSYFAIAAGMVTLSGILIFSLNRFPIRSILFSLITFWIGIIGGCILFLPYAGEFPLFWYAFKVVGWIIPLSTYIVFWAFVDQYYDLQEGKRFFCLFNGVIFLGDSIGGGMISSLLHLLTPTGLLFIFLSLLTLSLPFLVLITKRVEPLLEDHAESFEKVSPLPFSTLLKTILSSRFTIALLFFYFVMQLLAIATEFSYMDSFEVAFATADENALTEFIGKCGMWISLGNMVFCLFLYSRLIKGFGVQNVLMIAPAFFLGVFSFWIWKEALPIAIFGMIAREGMVYTFDDNNLQLLINGVPTKVKNQVRFSVESFFEPAGMLLSGLLLLLLPKGTYLGLVLALVAIGSGLLLRARYPRAIFQNLVASVLRFEKKSSDWLSQLSSREKKQTERLLLTHLKSGYGAGQITAFEYLLRFGDERLLPHLMNQIGKSTLPIKKRAIELLCESPFASEALVIERLEQWRRTLPHPEIKGMIHLYFARHRILRPEKISKDLEHPHLPLRSAAILAFQTNPTAFQFPSLTSLASEKLEALLSSKQEKEICAGIEVMGLAKSPENVSRIYPFLHHTSQDVQRAAAKALAQSVDESQEEVAEKMIKRMFHTQDPVVRMGCLSALEKFSSLPLIRKLILSSIHYRPQEKKKVERMALMQDDPELVPLLLSLTQDETLHDRCRLLAGRILAKKSKKTLQNHLYAIVKKEIKRAYFYFYHGNRIQSGLPSRDLSILENTLLTGYQSIIDFIIQLLGVAGSLEESEVLSYSLRSPNQKIRGQAIESLEKTCDGALFSLLEPLIDPHNPEKKIAQYLKSGGIPLTLNQLLDVLAHSPSIGDQIVSLGLKARFQIPDWRTTLRQKLETHEEIFSHFAHELLEEV
ncbi:MAG: hypothetical protein K940chlam9_00427 [Chlamydiae bacterium]|nr:hypothetical protein [Chlamydiota bacterium]